MSADNVIEIGFHSDVPRFVEEIKKRLSSVKDWGIAESLKDEFNDVEKMLDGLSKSFSEGMNSKLDTKSFAAFEKKITEEVLAVEKRVTTLEDTLRGLVMTMDTADSGQFTTYLSNVGSEMKDLKTIVDETVQTVKKLVEITSNSNGVVKFANSADIQNLQKELDLLKEIEKLKFEFENDDISSGRINLLDKNQEKENLKRINNTFSKLQKAYDKIQEASKGSDAFALTKYQNEFMKLRMDLSGLLAQIETFGQLDKIPNNIHKFMQDTVDYVDELSNRAIQRMHDIEDISQKLAGSSTISMDKTKNELKIPIEISTTGRGLAKKAIRIIETAQNEIQKNPLKIEFEFVSKYSSKKTNALLKQWQNQIDNIDNEELKTKFKDLYQTIAKDFQKDLKLTVSPDVGNAEKKVKDVINGLKKSLQEKIHILPKFDIADVDIAELQKKLDSISSQLKLSVSNIDIKKTKNEPNEKLDALTVLSQTLEKNLDKINKSYLGPIKSSLFEILTLAKNLNSVSEQADLPINEIVESVKELTAAFQKAFGIFTQEDLDSLFEKMRISIAGINGDLRGGDNNKLVVQLKEILALYKQYKDMGGANALSDLGGAKNVQNWLSKHANDIVTTKNPFAEEGKNSSVGYAEGIRSGIPEVKEAAKELVENAIEAIRATQDSNSPAKTLGRDLADGYITGFREKINELRDTISAETKETINKALKISDQKNIADNSVKTVVMSRKELKEYLKQYSTWKDSEDFEHNFKMQLEAMQKDGRAFREKTKSGKWKAWQYKVDVPVNQIKNDLAEVSEAVEKTDQNIASQNKGTQSFKEEANSVEALKKQLYDIVNKGNYSSQEIEDLLGLDKNLVNRKMIELTFGGASKDQIVQEYMKLYDAMKNNGEKAKEISNEIAEVAKTEAKVEENTTKKITKSTQEKINKYNELRKALNSVNLELSNMNQNTRAEKKAYNAKKQEARQIELEMESLVESARKRNKVDLVSLAGGLGSSDKEVKEATTAIKEEGKAAKTATKKKEGFAKANRKIAEASKETASKTKDAAKSLKEEYEYAKKYREKVLREEQKYRRAIAKMQAKEREQSLQTEQKYRKRSRDTYENMLNPMLKTLNGSSYQKDFIEPFQVKIDSLKEKISNLLKFDDIDIRGLREVREEFQKLENTIKNPASLEEVVYAKATNISNDAKKIETFLANNSAMSENFKDQLIALKNELDSGSKITVKRLNEIMTSFNQISSKVIAMRQTGLSFTDLFVKQLKSMNAQLLATYFSIYDIIRYLRMGFRTVVEVDTALTTLRKVSDASTERLAMSFKESTRTAKELGDTISDVINVTADWARLGYPVDEAEKLAKVTTLFKSVGDNMSAEDSSSYLISTIKGFGKSAEEAEHIVDIYNEVANNWAIDTAGIGEALQRSAASFSAANTDIEKAVALITATNTVVQDPDSVGTLWKTMSARIRGAKTELEDLGEEEDQFTKTTSKLRGLVMGLTGFDILEEDLETYKDIYEIVLGIGKAWKNLSDIEQASLAEALAGKRNSNALLAVFGNLDVLEGAYKSALESTGSAQKEQERYMKSLQYSIDKLKATAQEFWTTFINSKTAKIFIEFLTKALEILTRISKATHGMAIAPTGILLAMFGMNPREFIKVTQSMFDGILVKLGVMTTSMNEVGEVTSRTVNAFKAIKLSVAGIAAALAITAAVKVWEHFNVTVEETQESIDEITEKISELNSTIKELQDLETRTPEQESRLSLLREELQIQERLLEIENRRKVKEMFSSSKDSIIKQVTDAFDKENYSTVLRKYQEKWVRSDKDGKNQRTYFSDVMTAYDSAYKKLQEKLNKYNQEMRQNAVGSRAWEKASENYKKVQKEIKQRTDSLEKAYDREYEYYLQFSNIVLNIKKLRDSYAEDDPIQEELKKWQLIFENQLAQMQNALVRARERLGMSTDDLTLGSRLHTNLVDITKGNRTQFEELFKFTKNFTDEQKEAWIVVTKGAVNAKDAIDKWNKSLKEANNSTKFLSIDSSVLDSVTGINIRLKAQFDELASAYDAIFNGDNGFDLSEVDNDLLNSISETFVSSAVESELLSQEQATAAAEKFTRVLTDQKSTAIDVQNAFNELATSYFYAADGLKELNEENAEAIKQQLKKLGVKNADQVVDEYIRLKVDPDGYNKIKREVGKQMQEMEEGGTVDLHVRPVIDTKKLIEKEWNKVDPSLEPGGVATIFSSTFANKAGNVAINVTPILPNGEVLTPDELENYANMILEGVDSDEIPDIQLGAKFTGADAIEQAKKAAVTMHELQDVYYDLDEILLNITEDTFEESEARLKAAGVANAHALAVEFLNANLEAEALQEEAVKAATSDMAGETVHASESFIMEAQMSNLAKIHLADLVAAQTVFNQQGLDVDEKIAKLSSLATAYLGTAAAAKLVEMTNNRGYEHSYTLSPEEAWKQIIGEMATIEMPTIDFSSDGKNTKGAGGAGKDAADAYVEAYEKELKKLEDMRDRGLISEKEYLNRLKDLIDKYFKDREKYAEKYAEELKKYMDQMLSYYNSIISGVTTLLDKRINALQKNKDTTVDALNAEKDAAEDRYQTEIDAIEDEIDALEDQQDALDDQIDRLNEEVDKYQEMIDAINDANDARERELNLQKAQYELQRAQNQRTKLVYTGEVGQMRYERDESGVREAKENVKKSEDEISIAAIEKQIKLLEDEIKLIEKQKEELEDQAKTLKKQQEEVQEQLDKSNRYYEKLIKQQEKFYDDQIKALEKTKTKWEELGAIEEVSKAWGLISDEMEELGFTVEDVLNDVPGAFDAFKDKYVSVLQEMHSGDQGFLDGLKQNVSEIPTEFGKITTATSEAKQPLSDLSTAADTASTKVSTLGTSASTASTGVSSLKTASEGISDNLNSLNEVASFEGLTEALIPVEEALSRIKELLGGVGDPSGNSISGAIAALNTLKLDEAKNAFVELAGAISGVVSALNGGGGGNVEDLPIYNVYRNNGFGEGAGADTGGGGLVSAIQAVKSAAENYIGTNSEEAAENTIGSFVALLEAIKKIIEQIGEDTETESTLLSSISIVSDVSQEAINGEDGAVSAFNDLKTKIDEVTSAARELLDVLKEIASMEVSGVHTSSSGNQHGGSSGSFGGSNAQGNPNVKTSGRSLVGELGPEVVVRGDKYRVVGTDGPEFVNLKKGDIVLNSKQTKELFEKKKDGHGKAFAEGSGFTSFNFTDSYNALLNKVKAMDIPTMSEIKTSIDTLTRTVQSEIKNITTTKTNVTQNNTFNISGVTGEEVAEKINNTLVTTFSGMSLNAYQRSMA